MQRSPWPCMQAASTPAGRAPSPVGQTPPPSWDRRPSEPGVNMSERPPFTFPDVQGGSYKEKFTGACGACMHANIKCLHGPAGRRLTHGAEAKARGEEMVLAASAASPCAWRNPGGRAGAEDDDETTGIESGGRARWRCWVGFGSALPRLFGEVSQDPSGSRRSIYHVAAAVGRPAGPG